MVLAPLAPLALALLCLAVAAGLTIITLAAISVLQHAPVIGNWLADKAQALQQSISHALGVAFSGIDHLIAATIHAAARHLDSLWAEVRGHAALIAETAAALVPLAGAVSAVYTLAHNAAKAYHGIEHGVRDLRKTIPALSARVKALEKDWSKGIGHDLRIGLKAAEKELHRVERQVIPGIRSDVAGIDKDVSHLYDWLKGKANIIGLGTFAGAVTAVLATLGLDWIACRSRNSVNGKSGCNLWDDIEGLLGIATAAVVVADFEDLIHEAQGLIGGVVAGLDDLWNLK